MFPTTSGGFSFTVTLAVVSTPEQFDAVIRSDTGRFGELLEAAGVTPK